MTEDKHRATAHGIARLDQLRASVRDGVISLDQGRPDILRDMLDTWVRHSVEAARREDRATQLLYTAAFLHIVSILEDTRDILNDDTTE